MTRFTVLTLLLLFLPLNVAYAQDSASSSLEIEEHITGLDIESHFNHIEELYTGAKPDLNAIGAFLEAYPTEDFILTDTVLTNRGDMKPETIVKTKESFIQDEKERVYELLDTRIRHTLTDIEYLDDKLSAKVSYTALYQGTLKKNTQTYGWATMGFKSLSVCTNILKLVNGQMKGVKADCKTEIIYDDPVPVN